MSYSIPTAELTLSNIQGFRTAAVEAGIIRAESQGLGNRKELVVRDLLPLTDLGTAATGWLTEEYITVGAVAGPAWIWAFSFAAVPQLARTKVAVFYGWADVMAAPIATAVRFRVGATGATTKAVFHTQMAIQAKMEPDVYFSEPVVYSPEDFAFIEIYTTAATPAGGEQIPFRALIIERVGGTVS